LLPFGNEIDEGELVMPLLLIIIILLLLLGGGAAWALEGILRIILIVILAVMIIGLIARMGRSA
jgi:hypothetical protein